MVKDGYDVVGGRTMISASMPVCTCDRCGCRLDRGSLRYEMKVGVRLAPAARLLTDDDLEENHLHAVARMLSDLPDDQPAPVEPEAHHAAFVLCPACCRRWRHDPLGNRMTR